MNTMQMNKTRLIDQYECFTSSGKWEDGSILTRHERETDNGYARRKAGFCSTGLYSYLIKTYGILFAKTPTRAGQDDVYQLFIDNCGYGMDLNSFIEYSLGLGVNLGCVAIVMDADKVQPDSVDDMKNKRTFPFMEVVLPQNFTALEVDRVGRLKAFGYQFYKTDDTSRSMVYEKTYKSGKVTVSHNETDKDGKVTEVIDSENDLLNGVIPVIIIVPSREPLVTSKVPSSPTFDLYKQQLNIAVTNSLMDESLYAQQFSVLCAITDIDLKDVTLGSNNILKLPIGSSLDFKAPSGTPIEMMLKRVEASTASMIKTFANMLTNGTTQSGEAKVIDRQVGALQLKNVSNYLEQIEYKIYELFNLFMKTPQIGEYEYTVTYFKDFDLTDIGSYINQALDMMQLGISDETKAEIKASVVRKFFSGESPEMVTKLVEIEENNTMEKETNEDQINEES